MDFNKAIDTIMPFVKDGDMSVSFIISKQDDGWIVNYSPIEKPQEFLADVKEKDPYAVVFTGADFARGSFPYVFDKVVVARLHAEYDTMQYGELAMQELNAIIDCVENNSGEFSSEVMEYLVNLDRPLYTLNDIKPFPIKDEKSDYGYNTDDANDFIELIENYVEKEIQLDNLYDKMQAEYDRFIEGLKELPFDRLIEKSYEKIFKEEILGCIVNRIELRNIDEDEVRVLLKLDCPLQELYDGWMDDDVSYLDMLRDSIYDTIEELIDRDNTIENLSFDFARDCASAIDKAVDDVCTPGEMAGTATYDLDLALKTLTDKFGAARVNAVLAAIVRQNDNDGRFSQANKDWANKVNAVPYYEIRYCVIKVHPTVLNGLVDKAREKVAERQTEKPSLIAALEVGEKKSKEQFGNSAPKKSATKTEVDL